MSYVPVLGHLVGISEIDRLIGIDGFSMRSESFVDVTVNKINR